MSISLKPSNLITTITGNNNSYKYSYVKKITETDTTIEKLQDKMKTFKSNVKKLKRYSSEGVSKSMLEKQLTDLVKSYNDLESSAETVTDKDVQKQISKLEKLFSDNEKDLKKIGIKKTKNKYEFDSKVFEDADDKIINTLFIGHDSFIENTDKIMRSLESSSDSAEYSITKQKMSRTLNYTESDLELAKEMIQAGETISNLKSTESTDNSNLQDNLRTFAKLVYRTNTTDEDAKIENENIQKLNQLCLDNKEKLAKLGLTFDEENKNMLFHEDIDVSSDDFKNTYNELFGENASFGNTATKYCRNIFSDIIQPGKIGVSLLDEQV